MRCTRDTGAEFVSSRQVHRDARAGDRTSSGLNLKYTLSDRVVVPGQTLLRASSPSQRRRSSVAGRVLRPERLPVSDKTSAYNDSDVISVGAGGVATRELEYETPRTRCLRSRIRRTLR